jgi:hypothetical protein
MRLKQDQGLAQLCVQVRTFSMNDNAGVFLVQAVEPGQLNSARLVSPDVAVHRLPLNSAGSMLLLVLAADFQG